MITDTSIVQIYKDLNYLIIYVILVFNDILCLRR